MFSIRRVVLCALLIALAVPAMAASKPRKPAVDVKTPAAEREAKLIAVLQSSEPKGNKAMACKQLAICGSKDAVPVLAPLLADEELASWTRIALEAIPDPSAGDALREAMGKVKGRLLIGVINSIGVRRDAKALDGLIERLKDADAEVASAAAAALGRIGGPAAAKALEQSLAGAPAAARSAVAEGCILCAEKSLAEGKAEEAARLYDVVRKADVPKNRVEEATRGAILAKKSAGVPLLADLLKSADKSLFNLGLRVARELPGREVTDVLSAELGRAAPDRQALLIMALADRGDATASPIVLQAAKEGPEKVRIAAIRVLGRVPSPATVPVLLAAAMETNDDLSQAALTVLADLADKEIDADLVARLAKAEGNARLVLIQIAGLRHIEAAIPALLKAADDADGQVRTAAVTALGHSVGPRDLQVLIARVAKSEAKPEEAKAAEDALRVAAARMPDREACAQQLLAAMPKTPAVKGKFLEVLGVLGGAKALEAVAAAAKDANPEIQDAGSRLLGEWMTADAAPVLLDLAKTSADAKYKIRALRGYLRIARQLDVPLADRIVMCREALKLSERNEEKKLVLEVLRRYPSAEGLSLAVPLVREAPVKNEAILAAVSIAEKIAAKAPAAVAEAMKQVIDAKGNADITGRAKAVLDQATSKAGGK